jgi:hypothetical protein
MAVDEPAESPAGIGPAQVGPIPAE